MTRHPGRPGWTELDLEVPDTAVQALEELTEELGGHIDAIGALALQLGLIVIKRRASGAESASLPVGAAA